MEAVTLGLSFSTRMLGMAVFHSNTLVDYAVRLNKAKWSDEKRDLILTFLASTLRHYTLSHIVVLLPEQHCQTHSFQELYAVIGSFATIHDIPLVAYPAKEVYQTFSPVKRERKRLMKRLALLYPELSTYHERELVNKNKYYIKLFEAVAVSTYHWLQTNKMG